MRTIFTILGWQWDHLVSLLGMNYTTNLVSNTADILEARTGLFSFRKLNEFSITQEFSTEL